MLSVTDHLCSITSRNSNSFFGPRCSASHLFLSLELIDRHGGTVTNRRPPCLVAQAAGDPDNATVCFRHLVADILIKSGMH